MDFQAFNPSKPPSKMGVRSSLVLAKLGFDLRDHYEGLLDESLPEELRRLIHHLQEREAPRASQR